MGTWRLANSNVRIRIFLGMQVNLTSIVYMMRTNEGEKEGWKDTGIQTETLKLRPWSVPLESGRVKSGCCVGQSHALFRSFLNPTPHLLLLFSPPSPAHTAPFSTSCHQSSPAACWVRSSTVHKTPSSPSPPVSPARPKPLSSNSMVEPFRSSSFSVKVDSLLSISSAILPPPDSLRSKRSDALDTVLIRSKRL